MPNGIQIICLDEKKMFLEINKNVIFSFSETLDLVKTMHISGGTLTPTSIEELHSFTLELEEGANYR